MASDQEILEAKAATVDAIVRWSVIGARERAEVLGNLGDGHDVFSLHDLLSFWADQCPEVLQLLAKHVPLQFWDCEEDHAPR